MKFKELTQFLQKLEKTTKHLQMIDILVDLFKKTSKTEIDIICYMILGNIKPAFEEFNLGMAQKTVLKSIALATKNTGTSVNKKMSQLGDVGFVAENFTSLKQNPFTDFYKIKGQLEVKNVYQALEKIGLTAGPGSQEIKQKVLASLLIYGSKLEQRYIARLAVQNMRLSVGDMTILDALAKWKLGSRKKRQPLEQAYYNCSDIGQVAKTLAKSGLSGVKQIGIQLNKPVQAMLAQRVAQISEIREHIVSKKIAIEEKYDGERIQAHKKGNQVKLFSRRLIDVSDQFPDIAELVRKNIKAKNAILDGEAVAYDFNKKQYYPFQKLMRRRRKYEIQKYTAKYPVKYMLFDIIYLNGKSLMSKSYLERRQALQKIVRKSKYITLAGQILAQTAQQIQKFFNQCLKNKLEGIVCKSTAKDSLYKPGAREWLWIKWKKEYLEELADTFDLVVVGGFAGRGKRSGTYGSLLCAAYNKEKDEFQTATKLGAGFTEKELFNLPKKLKLVLSKTKPSRVFAKKEMKPDVWFEPKYVLELIGAEITASPIHTAAWDKKIKKGLAIRFPRFLRWRPDKSPAQATTSKAIKQMYLKK